ncbi:MAG: hypothetical protein R8K21_01760 [Mariprofundales bacterium]
MLWRGFDVISTFRRIFCWQIWLPFLACILFQRGFIIAFFSHDEKTAKSCLQHVLFHAILSILGFLLYAVSLQYAPIQGLPPVHHWWAKVFMFFNLCMIAIHLLPITACWLAYHCQDRIKFLMQYQLPDSYAVISMTILAATPIFDWLLGGYLIFPIYEWLATQAFIISAP